jgi:hypothetical protein
VSLFFAPRSALLRRLSRISQRLRFGPGISACLRIMPCHKRALVHYVVPALLDVTYGARGYTNFTNSGLDAKHPPLRGGRGGVRRRAPTAAPWLVARRLAARRLATRRLVTRCLAQSGRSRPLRPTGAELSERSERRKSAGDRKSLVLGQRIGARVRTHTCMRSHARAQRTRTRGLGKGRLSQATPPSVARARASFPAYPAIPPPPTPPGGRGLHPLSVLPGFLVLA